MRKKGIPVMNVGISLIILIFMNLCLVTFSVLSLENAVTDQRLSQKTADHTSAYYEAVNEMQNSLKTTQEQLKTLWDHAAGKKEYYKAVQILCKKKQWESGKNQEGDYQICHTQKVSDKQNLKMTLVVKPPNAEGICYEVKSFQLQAADTWNADRSLDVYTGDN